MVGAYGGSSRLIRPRTTPRSCRARMDRPSPTLTARSRRRLCCSSRHPLRPALHLRPHVDAGAGSTSTSPTSAARSISRPATRPYRRRGTVTVRVGVTSPPTRSRWPSSSPTSRRRWSRAGRHGEASPAEDAEVRRAVTVSYEVPRAAHGRGAGGQRFRAAISVHGVGRRAHGEDESGAISLSAWPAEVEIATGSGAVSLTGAAARSRSAQTAAASSSASLRGNLDAHTQSGSAVRHFTGPGDVSVETGSSEISLSGVNGSLTTKTEERPHDRHRQAGRPGPCRPRQEPSAWRSPAAMRR